jgi:hypothetical protein
MPVKVRQRAVRIGKLTTVLDVAAEIGKVYRDARHEKIDVALGNRLANILSAMRQCLETAEFERRIAEIEAAIKAKVGGSPTHGQSGQATSPVDRFVERNSERDLDEPEIPKSDRRH